MIISGLINSIFGIKKPAEDAAPLQPPPASQSQQQQPAQSSFVLASFSRSSERLATIPSKATPTSTSEPAPAPETIPDEPSRPHTHVLSRRSFRQLGLFAGGGVFMGFSVFLTRRAVRRHQLNSALKFFEQNYGKVTNTTITYAGAGVDKKDPFLAVQAFNLATLHVMSFAMMMAGGVSWVFDISSIDDLRWLARKSIKGSGVTDEAAEKEIAEWMAKTLGVKETAAAEEEQSKS